MKNKYLNIEQVKYLPESIKSAADKTEHIIKSSDKRSFEEISVITEGVASVARGDSPLTITTYEALKTWGVLRDTRKAYFNVTDPTGLAVPALDLGEEVGQKITMLLPNLISKAITAIRGSGFEFQEVTNISNTLQQIQDKTITVEDGFNRLKEIQRKLGYHRGPLPPADLDQRKLDYNKDVSVLLNVMERHYL